MTSPVTTVAPAARAAATSDPGGTDSAAPFASALDGALGARSEVDGAGAQAGGDPSADEDQAAADDATETPAEPAATAPVGVVAALWALLSGAASAAPVTDAGAEAAGVTAVGTPVAADGTPPGLAVAQARAAGVAHGLHGTQPGQVADGAPSATDAKTAAVPAPAAPTSLPPAAAAARAAAEALAAAGIQGIAVETAGTGTAAAGPAEALTGTAAPVAAPVAVPSEGEAAPAATAPSANGSPVAAAEAAGGTAADTGSGAGSGSGDETGSASTDAVPTTGQAAPAAATTSVTRTEAATGDAAAQPVGGQIAKHVAVLRGGPDGSHTMTVVLNPESLGPVEVSVTVSQGTVELTLRGAHEHGRAALLDAIPDLRRDLEAAGLTCSRLDVDRGGRDGSWSSSQQNAGRFGEQGPGGRGSQQDRPHADARPWHRSADTGDGPRATTRSASGLDVRV